MLLYASTSELGVGFAEHSNRLVLGGRERDARLASRQDVSTTLHSRPRFFTKTLSACRNAYQDVSALAVASRISRLMKFRFANSGLCYVRKRKRSSGSVSGCGADRTFSAVGDRCDATKRTTLPSCQVPDQHAS